MSKRDELAAMTYAALEKRETGREAAWQGIYQELLKLAPARADQGYFFCTVVPTSKQWLLLSSDTPREFEAGTVCSDGFEFCLDWSPK